MDPLAGGINPDDFTAGSQQKMDEQLLVRFMIQPRQDKTQSIEAGRPVFRDCEFIEIRVPGSRDAIARPARPSDIERFPRHYEAFKKRAEMPQEGTPLAEWPIITRSLAEELSFLNIKTVEALASVADTHMGKIRGLAGFKRKAQEWLDLAKDDAPLEKLHAELEKRDNTIAAQAQMLEDLGKRLSAMEKAQEKPVEVVNVEPDVEDVFASAMADIEGEPEVEMSVLKKRRRRKES